MQSDQPCSIGADMTSETSLSLSMYNLLLYGLHVFSMDNDSDRIGEYMRQLLARYDSIRWALIHIFIQWALLILGVTRNISWKMYFFMILISWLDEFYS